jgi:transglutaminase-like putative cysteine protease
MIAVIGVLAVGAVMYLVRPAPSAVGNQSPPPRSQVRQVWTTNQGVAMTIQRQDRTDTGRYYWRAVTYDQIDLNSWTETNSTTIVRQPDTQLFAGLADAVDPVGLHSFTFTVTPGEFNGPTILSPGTPVEVKETTRLTYVGHTGYFATLERGGGSGSYTVTALTQPPADAPGQLTQAELRVAGTAYPQDVKDLYLQVAPGSIGTNARKLEDKVRAEAASSAPFDLASQIVTELHSSTYVYTTDVRDLHCATLSAVECFATYKRGFCQYYAATMAVLLRDLGVPTRTVDGFLPGAVNPNTGIETIQLSSAHTWVEVYFPGHGWVMFDPTGGNLAQVEPLPSG